jgi:hypothetical protein
MCADHKVLGRNRSGVSLGKRDSSIRRVQRQERLDDLENSEYARDPRFAPGWFIFPLLTIALMSASVAVFVL